MKSGLAAQIIAVEALRRAGLEPNVHQSAVPDEETVGVRNAGHGLARRAGPARRRRRDHHRAVRPRRRRHRPQGRDLGRDHDPRQAGARLRAAARRQRVEAMARYLRHLDQHLRPQLEQRITDYGVTPDNPRATLSFDTIRGGSRDQHRPRPLHGHVQPPARSRARTSTARAASCSSRSQDDCATTTTSSTRTEPTLVSEDEPVVQAAQARRRAPRPRRRRSSSPPAATTSASSSTTPASPTRSSTAPARRRCRTSPTSTSPSTTSCSARRASH